MPILLVAVVSKFPDGGRKISPRRGLDVSGQAAADEGDFEVRFVNVAAGQLGPIARDDTRTQVVARLSNLMRQAAIQRVRPDCLS